MTRRSPHKGPAYKGHDSHVHVTVSKAQRAKLLKLAKREGISLSMFVRNVIDDLEGAR